MEIQNLDHLVSEKNSNHKNKNNLAPQWTFRFLVCGGSGSGKTNMLLNLIMKYLHFDKLFIYSKSINQSKYQFLIKHITELADSYEIPVKQILYTSDKVEDVLPLSDLNEDVQNLVVFDDLLLEKDQSLIGEYFVASRHKNTSCIYLSQSYFDTPKVIRLNCNYFAIHETNGNNLTQLAREHSGGLSNDEFKKLFRKAVSEPFAFFLLDKKTRDKKMRYRRGFQTALVL